MNYMPCKLTGVIFFYNLYFIDRINGQDYILLTKLMVKFMGMHTLEKEKVNHQALQLICYPAERWHGCIFARTGPSS